MDKALILSLKTEAEAELEATDKLCLQLQKRGDILRERIVGLHAILKDDSSEESEQAKPKRG